MRTLALFEGFCFTFVQVCRVKVTPRLESLSQSQTVKGLTATPLKLHVFAHVTSKHQLPSWMNVASVSPEGSEAAGDVSTQRWTGERPARHMTPPSSAASSFSHFHSLTFCCCKSHELSLFENVHQTETNSFELQSSWWFSRVTFVYLLYR